MFVQKYSSMKYFYYTAAAKDWLNSYQINLSC